MVLLDIQEHTVSVTTVFPDFLVVVLQDLPPEPVCLGAHSDTDCVRMYSTYVHAQR